MALKTINKQTLISLIVAGLIAGYVFMAGTGTIEFNPENYKKFDKNIGRYGQISVWDNKFLGRDFELARHTLLNNSDECLINCFTEGKTTLYTKGKLFSGIKFKRINNKFKNISHVRILIKDNETYNVSVDDYSDNCSWKILNGSNTYVCERVGTYYWRIEGEKKPFEKVDLILNSFGQDLTEWVWWNSSWQYKREISNLTGYISVMTINYDSDMQSDFDDLRFTDSSESSELNYTIEDKSDGNWAVVRVNNLGADSIYMYYDNPSATTTSNASAVYYNPVLLYYFDEGSGTTAIDSSGQNNGTLNNGVLLNQAGKVKTAYSFDGGDDLVITDNSITYDKYTWAFWIKRTGSGGTNPRILTPSNAGWILWQKDASKGVGFYGTSLLTSTPPALNTWEHYVITYDRTTTYGDIYKDGSKVVSSGSASNSAASGSWVIGHKESTAIHGDSWQGLIDEVIIWNKQLSETQIKAIYNTTLPNYVLGTEESAPPTDTCTYSSGNWNVNCSDNCTITSDVTGDTGSNLSISGTGKFIMDADISGFTKYHIDGNCVVTCRNGCFKG